MRFCKYCGNQISEEVEKCNYCGKALDTYKRIDEIGVQTRKTKKKIILISILATVILSAVVCGIVFISHSGRCKVSGCDIETVSTELWRIMQKLLSVYAEEFNHKYSFTGHLFEGQYTACIIEDERYFLELSRYIHLNPEKAKMVREPLDYEYSSYPLFMMDNCEDNTNKISSYIAGLIDILKV